jgi:hypothetical protein
VDPFENVPIFTAHVFWYLGQRRLIGERKAVKFIFRTQDTSSVWDAVQVLFVRVHLLQRHVSHEPAARFCTYQSPAPRRHSEQVSDLVCVMCIRLVCYLCACGLMPRLTYFLTPQPVVATRAGLKAARPLGAAKLLRILAPSHYNCQRSGR